MTTERPPLPPDNEERIRKLMYGPVSSSSNDFDQMMMDARHAVPYVPPSGDPYEEKRAFFRDLFREEE